MFDAGAIEASLTVRLEQFNKDLDRAEERVRKFESERHEVKISAVFDTASMSKARKLFADLDQQISRDAATRLRTSPQGSVLGSLNALFSPHPVTGAPSPQQASQQGLLGKMFNTPGAGGGTPGPAPGRQQQVQAPGSAMPGGGGGGSTSGQARDSSGRFIGASPSQQQQQNQQQESILRRVLGSVFGESRIQSVQGRASNVKQQVEDSALLKSFNGAFGHIGSAAGAVGRSLAPLGNAGRLASAALPGILGISGKAATGIGVGGSLVGALPALLGPLAALGVGGAGIGASALLFKGVQSQISPISQAFTAAQQAQAAATTPAQAKAAAQQMAGVQQQINALNPALKSIFNSEQQIQGTWQKFTASFAPVFAGALTTVASSFQSLQPTLTTFFKSATTLIQPVIQGVTMFAKDALPGLGQAFQAAAPLMAPFFSGIGMLVKNLMPGLVTMLKAVQPILGVLEGILGNVGKELGAMFADFAPVMQPAAVLLKSLLDLVLSFLPLIGQLAKIFASSLAPAFQLFTGLIKQLTPVLIPIGQILAELAGAVLADLISILQPLVQLIGALAPSFAILAKVLGGVFNALENAGVFQVLASALESVAGPLAKFINMLVAQLAPFIPPLLSIVQALINAGITVFTDAILALLPILTQLVQALLPPLLQIVISLVPVISQLAALMARGLGDAITALAVALTPIVLIVAHLITGLIGWLNSTHLLLPVLALILLAIDPIPTAIGLIAIAIGYLAEHWQRIWGDIKQWAMDAWNFIWNGFGKFLLPLLGPVGLIALGAIELYQHWQTIWGAIKQVGLDFYQWIWNDFGAKIANFLTKTLPNAFDSAVSAISQVWGTIEGVFKTPANFLINTVYDNGIARLWNDVMGAIGLNSLKLPHIDGLASGGLIHSGTGPTADDVLIRASRGETVVSARHSAMLAPIFAAVGVPGYALGGPVADIVSSITGGSLGSLPGELAKLIGVSPGTLGELAQMFIGIPKKIVSESIHQALNAIKSGVLGTVTGIGGGGGGPTGSGPTANAALARTLAPLLGVASWASGADWTSWNLLEMREAGWNNFAMNPSSGAYGIPQALPYTKMPKGAWPPSAGGMADPTLQIAWMIQYILGRYGTPETAWGHELAFGWYGNGLDAIFSHPTVIGVGESGAEHVSVTPLATYGRRGGGAASLDSLIAAMGRLRPMIGTYQTAYYGTGDTAYALRELTRTLRNAELQATVVGP